MYLALDVFLLELSICGGVPLRNELKKGRAQGLSLLGASALWSKSILPKGFDPSLTERAKNKKRKKEKEKEEGKELNE